MERARSQETGIFKQKPMDFMQIFKVTHSKLKYRQILIYLTVIWLLKALDNIGHLDRNLLVVQFVGARKMKFLSIGFMLAD